MVNRPPLHLTGPNAQALLRPSSTIQKTLYARLESLNEQEVRVLGQILTPQTAPVLAKIFPELAPLMQAHMQARSHRLPAPQRRTFSIDEA